MLVKKSSKNQVTLPKAVADLFPDARYFTVEVKDGEIRLRPAAVVPEGKALYSVREKIDKLGISEQTVAEAVRWARKKK